LKVKIIPLVRGQILRPVTGNFDPQDQIITYKPLFKPKMSFTANPQHMLLWRRKPAFFVDLASKQTLSPQLKPEPDTQLLNRLDYLSERSFWQALLSKQKIPLGTILIYMLAGSGLLYLLRIVFYAAGIYVP